MQDHDEACSFRSRVSNGSRSLKTESLAYVREVGAGAAVPMATKLTGLLVP